MAGWDRDIAVEGYVDALTGVRALAHEVGLERWTEPTDLEGWSVQDQFSHVVSIESTLLGRTDPVHEPDYDKLPHCGEDWVKRHMERGVDLRRGRSAQDVRAELDDVVAARLLEVAALPDDPDVLVPGVLGKARPVGNVVPIRAFDVWAHEQDVRRAVGLDQRLTGPAAQAARDRILMALPDVLSESGLHQGSTVRWVVTGPLEFEAALRVTDDGAVPLEDAPSDVTMVMDWATFALLACGRAAPSKVRVAVEGDVAMAERVLDAMPITP